MKFLILVVLGVITFIPQQTYAQSTLPAFPGAQGYGMHTPGGRGGQVIKVTNLNDSGVGSLRSALEASGPRIVVFETGGLIEAQSDLEIKNPYITIAGQTAPGDGIAIKGTPISVKTHDVIIRGLRIRPGDETAGITFGNRDGLRASGSSSRDVYNVIFDHNSVAWAVDEAGSVWNNGTDPEKLRDITYSYNIFAETLACGPHPETNPSSCLSDNFSSHHSMGFIAGEDSKNLAFHHNLLSSNIDRNPYFRSLSSAIINNVMYNWKGVGLKLNDGNGSLRSDVIGNYFIPTDISDVRQNGNHGIYLKCDLVDDTKVYVKGNLGQERTSDTQDEWDEVVFDDDCTRNWNQLKANSSTLSLPHNISIQTAQEGYQTVIDKVGATLPQRDSIDERIINSVKNRTVPDPINAPGQWIINSPSEVGGYPSYSTGTAPTDSDDDGIPDTWEISRGMNEQDASDANQYAPSGYTWIEEYINSFYSDPQDTSPSPSPLPCSQDINQDGTINILDYSILVGDFLKNDPANPRSDINGDGNVNIIDYSLLAASFFQDC